jgi:hypothetical protein
LTYPIFVFSLPQVYHYAFPYFLYPFSEIALCSSMYMTVAIAVERYIGLCRPMRRLSGRGPFGAHCYILPAVALSFLLNVPKFFESKTVRVPASPASGSLFGASTPLDENATVTDIDATWLRKHPAYITYYQVWTRLLATGVVPLIVLALLNTKIYLAIRQSKQQLRILAIRSALPMAILGQAAGNAANGPLADLMSSGGGNGEQDSRRGGASRGVSGGSAAGATNGRRERESPPQANGGAGTSTGANGIAAAEPTASSSPRPGAARVVNGHLRQIQRSVSAFEPTIKRTLRLKDPHILRSNSTTAAATTGGSSIQPSGSVMALSTWNNPANADVKLAPILFGVVIVFVCCNSLRVVLNVYDFLDVDAIIECQRNGITRYPPTWVYTLTSVSHFLLMVNSSVNFLVYCVAGTRFRRILISKIRPGSAKGIGGAAANVRNGGAGGGGDVARLRTTAGANGSTHRPLNGRSLTASLLAQHRRSEEDILREENEEADEEDEEDLGLAERRGLQWSRAKAKQRLIPDDRLGGIAEEESEERRGSRA